MGVLQGLVSTGGYLYAAWKGVPDDDRIFYSRWNGSGDWAAASPMASGTVAGNTNAGPSLGLLGTTLYAAWKGEWSDPRLFFAKFNGSNWENQLQIPNAYSDVGPALCSFGSNQMVAAWKSIDQSLWYATYNGTKWTAPTEISGVASSVGPSLANLGGKVYAAWKGEGGDQSLWYSHYDGTTWQPQKQISGVASSVGPSLAVVGTNLYAVWKGEGSDESLWYSYYDGTSWQPQTQIAGMSSSVGAAIAAFGGNIYAMGKGKDADNSLYTAEFTVSSKSWSGWSKAIPGNTGPDPITLLPLPTPQKGSVNYLLADGKGAGAALTGTTVTIIVVEDIVTDNNADYSFQINCFATPQAAGSQTFGWQQYGYRIANNELFFWVNTFQKDFTNTPTQYINWDSRVLAPGKGVVPLSNNRLPAGWQLTTTLATDASNNNKVTGVTFSVTQPNGTVTDSGLQTLASMDSSIGLGNMAPIANFQVVLVAENIPGNGPTDTVSFSAGNGIFLCYANNNLEATAAEDETGEQSNMKYSQLPATYPNGEFFQFFGVPAA